MAKKGVIPTEDAFGRIRAVVQHVERTQPARKARRQPRRRALGGGGGDCPEVHEITTTSAPTSGTATLTYDIDGTSDTVTINWDDTAAEVLTAMETHSNVASGDVACTGGPLPRTAVYIRFAGNHAGLSVDLPTISDSLTGGQLRMRKASAYDWGA